MANSFGSLHIGVAGLQSSQNALNITSNNLANVDTTGYVRQRVIYADRDYLNFNTTASISYQQSGLGVKIGDVIHTRDIFLDRSYRTESGRQAFYAATYEATQEVETLYQELEGQAFQDAVEDFWTAFQEFAKAPDDSIYQNLVVQKAQLFLSRGNAVYSGLQSYQYNINTQISDDIDRINELGKTIYDLNLSICGLMIGNLHIRCQFIQRKVTFITQCHDRFHAAGRGGVGVSGEIDRNGRGLPLRKRRGVAAAGKDLHVVGGEPVGVGIRLGPHLRGNVLAEIIAVEPFAGVVQSDGEREHLGQTLRGVRHALAIRLRGVFAEGVSICGVKRQNVPEGERFHGKTVAAGGERVHA